MSTHAGRWLFRAIVPVFVAAMTVASPARAAFVAYLCDDILCTGGGDTIVTDQGVGDNFPGSAFVGQINAGAISIGGFTIATNVANSGGTAASPTLDLTFSAVTNDNLSHTIYLYASATGFTAQGTLSLNLGGTQPPANPGNVVVGRAFGGTTNTNLNLTNLLGSVTSASSPFALVNSSAFTSAVNPYSLTIGVQITRTTAGSTGGGLELALLPTAAVPEPETVALLAVGIAGLSIAVRRRRRPSAAA